MMDVTLENFAELYPIIENSLKKAKFIAIDTEFSSLNPTSTSYNSLFDSASDRYKKLRQTVELIIPIQIGVTAFSFDRDQNSYEADSYTFYVYPRSFSLINKKFVCQASSLYFLAVHGFDFNKLIHSGISYLNRAEETEIKNKLTGRLFDMDIENAIESSNEKIGKWLSKAKTNDVLKLEENHKHNAEVLYFLHKSVRDRGLWSYVTDEGFCVKKVAQDEFKQLIEKEDLEEDLLDHLLGFTKIFRLLTDLKKPIIGHNILMDISLIVHTFEEALPHSYKKYKSFLHELFPIIYDTKTISYDLRNSLPASKQWKRNLLEILYVYFKDGDGRHLALNSPYIKMNCSTGSDQFHNAGFDSYCTGYIFIRMAHLLASEGTTNPKQVFMSSQLLAAVSAYKNCLNVIRCAIFYMKLDGDDPVSTRPPWLVVESVQNKPVDLSQVSKILSNYGCVEIRPLKRGRQAIVAVDNFVSARRILSQCKARNDFRIKQYNILQHSLAGKAAVWSGYLVSTFLMIWLARNAF